MEENKKMKGRKGKTLERLMEEGEKEGRVPLNMCSPNPLCLPVGQKRQNPTAARNTQLKRGYFGKDPPLTFQWILSKRDDNIMLLQSWWA